MTTETRSVAEIMGWVPDPLDYRQDTFGGWELMVDPEPTPDDMLAWLQERGHDVNVQTWRKYGDVTLTVRTIGHSDTIVAPTLHAALEAAVRAVAGDAGE